MQNHPANLVRAVCFSLLLLSCQPSNDAKIEQSVKSGVSILDPGIQVSVADGVVTLSGAVRDSTTKNAAATSIKEIKGVKAVINQITINTAR